MFDEACLKRALIKSIRAQGGLAFRIEDKYAVGRPDLFMKPKGLVPFLAEAKMLKGRKLICTETQAAFLEDYHQPPLLHAVILAFDRIKGHLFVGRPGRIASECGRIDAPARLMSSDWNITPLLAAYTDAYPPVSFDEEMSILLKD